MEQRLLDALGENTMKTTDLIDAVCGQFASPKSVREMAIKAYNTLLDSGALIEQHVSGVIVVSAAK